MNKIKEMLEFMDYTAMRAQNKADRLNEASQAVQIAENKLSDALAGVIKARETQQKVIDTLELEALPASPEEREKILKKYDKEDKTK